MYIIKRNGEREDMLLDKITSRIKKLCYGLDQKYVDPAAITLKVRRAATAAKPLDSSLPSAPPTLGWATRYGDCEVLSRGL